MNSEPNYYYPGKVFHNRVDKAVEEYAAKIPEDPRALDTQVGGGHYKDCKIQPIEFIVANNLGYCEANIVKYATRHKLKGGRQDIEKVIHYAQLLLEMEYEEAR